MKTFREGCIIYLIYMHLYMQYSGSKIIWFRMLKSSTTLNTPKISFSSVMNVEIILCLKIQGKSICQEGFLTCIQNERIYVQGTRRLFVRSKVKDQSF